MGLIVAMPWTAAEFQVMDRFRYLYPATIGALFAVKAEKLDRDPRLADDFYFALGFIDGLEMDAFFTICRKLGDLGLLATAAPAAGAGA